MAELAVPLAALPVAAPGGHGGVPRGEVERDADRDVAPLVQAAR